MMGREIEKVYSWSVELEVGGAPHQRSVCTDVDNDINKRYSYFPRSLIFVA